MREIRITDAKSLEEHKKAAACPDCASEVALVQQAPSVYVVTVAHDATCPALKAMGGP